MSRYICSTCHDTGEVEVAVAPDQYEMVPCPDCDSGLKSIGVNEENDIFDL